MCCGFTKPISLCVVGSPSRLANVLWGVTARHVATVFFLQITGPLCSEISSFPMYGQHDMHNNTVLGVYFT